MNGRQLTGAAFAMAAASFFAAMPATAADAAIHCGRDGRRALLRGEQLQGSERLPDGPERV